MARIPTFGQLCLPAKVYFSISAFFIVLSLIQNMRNGNGVYSLGTFSRRVPSKLLIFALKIGYVLFWTYILNLICRDGHSTISWLLVLLPFLLAFVGLAVILLG